MNCWFWVMMMGSLKPLAVLVASGCRPGPRKAWTLGLTMLRADILEDGGRCCSWEPEELKEDIIQ